MVWFKVDDTFWSHPKVLTLSDSALALWVRAGAYCAQQLTDGVVSPQALRMVGERDSAVELVNAGLWEIRPDVGFVFHDWAKYQPTRDQVRADRAAAAERKRRSREAREKSQRESQRDARGTDVVIPGVRSASPTRPDPTRPDHPSSTPDGALEGDARALPPFCPKHMPKGPNGQSCRACGDAKMARIAQEAAWKARPTPLPPRIGTPPRLCPDGRHQLLADGTCVRCEYRTMEVV